jgi:cerevisin
MLSIILFLLFGVCFSQIIPNKYIVVLKNDLNINQIFQHYVWINKHSSIDHIFQFQDSFHGYIGTFFDSDLKLISSHSDVDYIENDQIVSIYDQIIFKKQPPLQCHLDKNVPWGLSRISHRDKLYTNYAFDPNTGHDVVVYVIDTGINIHHQEFQGRAEWGTTIPLDDYDIDGNGHGTHCAGTIAGKTFGVAKKAKVVAVKVLNSNGSGSMSDVIKGIEWVALDKRRRKNKSSVANMSLGGGKSRALDSAVDSLSDSGVHFVVAAGNDNQDACSYSPAASHNAITVGATTIQDSRAWFSNWGQCVDIFAPGHNILSSWIGSTNATNIISGTSMASPHVAGVVASFLSRPIWNKLSPVELKDKLIKIATLDKLKNINNPQTPNKLVYTEPCNLEE